MQKPFASLSLDLDNKWSYLKTHGDSDWGYYPSFLGLVVPRILQYLADRQLNITFFVVGRDVEQEENRDPLQAIVQDGHEIGNHSYHHEPWLDQYTREELQHEFELSEDALVSLTAQRPSGFRGPGYSFSPQVLTMLGQRGYQYDASTLPTFLGPLARAYYFFTAHLTDEQRQKRKRLFGGWRDGLRPLKPYVWRGVAESLVEIPVTTMPVLRTPMHLSYLIYLGQYSLPLARCYFRTALRLCELTAVEPSLLLHPLDFLGQDDDRDLRFFPGMRWAAAQKLDFVQSLLDLFHDRYQIGTMRQHAQRVHDQRAGLTAATPAASAPTQSDSVDT